MFWASMSYNHTLGKKDKVTGWDTNGAIETNDNSITIKTDLYVKGRNVVDELDARHKAMLLLPRDQKLEDKYPELKEAYDAYNELYKEIMIADKMSNT